MFGRYKAVRQPQPENDKAQLENEDDVDFTQRDPISDPAPRDHTVKCRITRNRKGIRGLFPTFFLHMERGDGKKIFLLTSRRRIKSSTCSYIMSADPSNMSCSGAAFRGLLDSNLLGTQFRIFGRKIRRKSGNIYNPVKPGGRRCELGSIIYDKNVLGFNGPRLMKVILPQPITNGNLIDIMNMTDRNVDLIEKYNSGEDDDLLVLSNKPPTWSSESQSYVINFHGRVTRASVKNFQIVSASDPSQVIMQFGKVGADVFTMDFRYPLCAIQAFGIALSSCISKLACE